MGNKNRKATKSEMAHAKTVIREAYPDMTPVFGGHGAYGGYRSPRDHTISFRLQDENGIVRSNVVWLQPDWLGTLTVSDVRELVGRANGKK